MPEISNESNPLPGFRPDLKLFSGPQEPDGSPTYNLQDPVKGKFFLFTWAEHLIFERLQPGMQLDDLVRNLNSTTTLRVTQEQIKDFLADCSRHGLLAIPVSSEILETKRKNQKSNFFSWLLYNYLFMRVPLFNPDKFLAKTLPYVRFLGSNAAFIVYGLIAFIGLLFLFLRFSEFINSFSFFFNIEGFIDYFFAISCVKIIHEFSHAYTAKRYGIYVPSMGIALIVLWPVLYTDVSDGWKLPKRKDRLYISTAGMIAETIIAGICTIGWALTQPGVLNNIFFVIASVTWVSTLVINLNPAIRFDGYYILSDLWGVDNLQSRTFAVARWKMRDLLLGLKAPCPEPRLSSKQTTGFVAYALYTWLYRLFLYTAIALFVYHTFTKALGIFLFFVEIGVFILWPLAWEIQDLKKMKEKLTFNKRSIATLSVLGVLLAWGILPLPHTESFPGVVVPLNQQVVYVPGDALVRQIDVKRNQTVKAGQLLVKLESPELIYNLQSLDVERRTVQKQLEVLAEDDKQTSYIPSKLAELATNEEKLEGLKDLQEEFNVKAQITGKLYEWNENIRVGMALPKDFVMGKIADPKEVEVVFFVPEAYLDTIKEGEKANFIVYSANQTTKGKVLRINPVRPQNLEYPALASLYKGAVPVSQEHMRNKLRIIEAYYIVHVRLDPTDNHLLFGKTGIVEVRGPWRSKLISLIEEVMRILWREGSL